MYYIIEHQHRPDGVTNVSEVSRTTLANALSYYHERYSKMVVNTTFTSVDIMLVQADLDVIELDHINTMYQPTTEEAQTGGDA